MCEGQVPGTAGRLDVGGQGGRTQAQWARLMSRHQLSPHRKVSCGHDVRRFRHFLIVPIKFPEPCFCEVRNVATRRQQRTGLHFLCRQQTARRVEEKQLESLSTEN